VVCCRFSSPPPQDPSASTTLGGWRPGDLFELSGGFENKGEEGTVLWGPWIWLPPASTPSARSDLLSTCCWFRILVIRFNFFHMIGLEIQLLLVGILGAQFFFLSRLVTQICVVQCPLGQLSCWKKDPTLVHFSCAKSNVNIWSQNSAVPLVKNIIFEVLNWEFAFCNRLNSHG
jgi:hypothetical protein